MTRPARFVPILALVAALALGSWILFGPTYSYCSTRISSSDPSPATLCGTTNLVTSQADHLFPAPVLWIAAWSLAPLLAVIGTRFGSRAVALALTGTAFAIDAMSIVSMGGGFVYALIVAPLLLLTLVLIPMRSAQSGAMF